MKKIYEKKTEMRVIQSTECSDKGFVRMELFYIRTIHSIKFIILKTFRFIRSFTLNMVSVNHLYIVLSFDGS
jgi:hypothetical protein